MEQAPKSLRLHIGIFGRTNVGKSSLLNFISGQPIAITSPVAGTTTDVVNKPMELLPLGPVVFLDTAGLDDISELGEVRLRKTRGVFGQADIITLVTEAGQWGDTEMLVVNEAKSRKIPLITVINKCDLQAPTPEFLEKVKAETGSTVLTTSSNEPDKLDHFRNIYKQALIEFCPEDFLKPPPLVADLVKPGETVVLLIPIDLQAPKGRLILPQVQALRDALDNDNVAIMVKESRYREALDNLKTPAALAVCDSQVVDLMVRETPPEVACTTFSIIFARLKGDMAAMAAGTVAIERLKKHGGKVLIAEACTHHPTEDDIGRLKIPRWLKRYTGRDDIEVDVFAGCNYPEDLTGYSLVIHCGACMLNRRAVLSRIQQAHAAGVPVTNYGMCISYCQGVLHRVLTPFPEALQAFEEAQSSSAF